ncbi:hypothetical protein M5K25_007540 [Dendrobium thyrsiflorum]|uniref:Uncharacterized protein n=1 Tax=Dendrobium thyrsiflorum TaxID=117978 RepID=A0ABD0VLJ8_DENTH
MVLSITNKLIVKLSGSELRTQRHQNRLNPSPNESMSRIRSALDETNPTSPRTQNSDISKSENYPSNCPYARDSTSAVYSNHSPFALDFSHIYKPCHSRKSINRALILHEKGPKLEGINREIRDCSCPLAPPRPPPEFCRTTARPPPEGPTPTFCRTTTQGLKFCSRPDVLLKARSSARGLTFCSRSDVLLKARCSAQGPTFCSRPDVLFKA